jgi:NADPH-dependent 2,4-dienoyl-CoA reductase/sulfur reductase-like enzyme
MDTINAWVAEREANRALVVGGGYIGLEMAEQLRERGLEVTLVEMLPQVMAPLDPEMAAMLHSEMEQNGVHLKIGEQVVAFEEAEGDARASTAVLQSGERLPADIVVLGLGVRPEVKLAKAADLRIGESGGISVDEHMRTSDPDIFAVGDAVEVLFTPTDRKMLLPLAGPANRQGRCAADNICGIPTRFEGVVGTAVLRLFSLTAACTGANEKVLSQTSISF